jgi:hypothetical protein
MKSVVKLIREFTLAGFLPKIAKIVTKSVMNIPGSREMYPLNQTCNFWFINLASPEFRLWQAFSI